MCKYRIFFFEKICGVCQTLPLASVLEVMMTHTHVRSENHACHVTQSTTNAKKKYVRGMYKPEGENCPMFVDRYYISEFS